jgi:CheY-like chemotaxis protein
LALIVDKHADTREMYAMSLNLGGFDTVLAQDGVEAFAKAINLLPDIIATDILLPHLDGHELCRWLKQQPSTSNIPVIAVTGLAYPSDTQKALLAGCVSVLVKPCPADVVLAEIRRVLRLDTGRDPSEG